MYLALIIAATPRVYILTSGAHVITELTSMLVLIYWGGNECSFANQGYYPSLIASGQYFVALNVHVPNSILSSPVFICEATKMQQCTELSYALQSCLEYHKYIYVFAFMKNCLTWRVWF